MQARGSRSRVQSATPLLRLTSQAHPSRLLEARIHRLACTICTPRIDSATPGRARAIAQSCYLVLCRWARWWLASGLRARHVRVRLMRRSQTAPMHGHLAEPLSC